MSLTLKACYSYLDNKEHRDIEESYSEIENGMNSLTWNSLINHYYSISRLTLEAAIPQNGQTHSNNLSATADELVEWVWSCYGIGTLKVKLVFGQLIRSQFQSNKGI